MKTHDPTEGAPATLHQIAADYVGIDDQISEAKANLKALNEAKAKLGEKLLDGMIVEGAPSVEVLDDDGRRAKVYPSSRTFARRDPEVSEQAFIKALIDSGHDYLVRPTVNSNSLSALIREAAHDAGVDQCGSEKIKSAIDSRLAAVIAVSTTPILAIRRTK